MARKSTALIPIVAVLYVSGCDVAHKALPSVGRIIVTSAGGEIVTVSVHKTQAFCWADIWPYTNLIVHKNGTVGDTNLSYPGYRWTLDLSGEINLTRNEMWYEKNCREARPSY